ncbi:hypothetical protein OEZ85_000791 [Tetradesmus obliquus]|uniref:Serine-threonine/tyrosine-protein kinase catalytic domain-containing protein n=1 Tax=Tetradesmus obliquus TaxID=3088 RepID=A0ABY8UMJ0_TETOB|nr:hypothetical protein OEZ85_000791 [Tetradesmus obliquus]
MSGVEEVDRSMAWVAVQELQGVLPALQQACQQAVGWNELQPVVGQAIREFNQVCKTASSPVLLAAHSLGTNLGMLLVQLQGMQQQEQHAMPSMQLLLWQRLVRGQAATVEQQLKDLRRAVADTPTFYQDTALQQDQCDVGQSSWQQDKAAVSVAASACCDVMPSRDNCTQSIEDVAAQASESASTASAPSLANVAQSTGPEQVPGTQPTSLQQHAGQQQQQQQQIGQQQQQQQQQQQPEPEAQQGPSLADFGESFMDYYAQWDTSWLRQAATTPGEKFHKLEPLGEGSFGSVYRGTWEGAEVAIKVLDSSSSSSSSSWAAGSGAYDRLRQLMEKEVLLQAKCSHPNVVKFYAMCYDPPAIVMELCSGGRSLFKALQGARDTLDLLQRRQQQQQQQHEAQVVPLTSGCRQLLDWQTRIELLRQAASVLAFMHQMPPRPLLHNDVRADNMLLQDVKRNGWVLKVADFGFAQEVAEPDDGCAAVEQHTNALWVAPEVLRSHKHSNCGHYTVTKASDVYSFAAVMSEVLTGLPPFAEPDENGCVNPMQHQMQDPLYTPTVHALYGSPMGVP